MPAKQSKPDVGPIAEPNGCFGEFVSAGLAADLPVDFLQSGHSETWPECNGRINWGAKSELPDNEGRAAWDDMQWSFAVC